ncbi:MAG TPA: molybdenum cofactor guanylyltransferase [Marmoricola sp.]
MEQPPLGAIVLTGGTAVRLDGADKASLEVGGRTLLDRALANLPDCRDVVVVGPEVHTDRPVTFRLEDPPFGGPAAGLIAGLGGFPFRPERVAVLAVDLPYVTPATWERLAAAYARDGAVLVDADGRRQPLCGLYATASLARSGGDGAQGSSMRALLADLDLVEVAAVGAEARDVDTWADVRDLRESAQD